MSKTYFVNAVEVKTTITTRPSIDEDHPIILRPYNFNAGDDLRVDVEVALACARERARISGRIQQVKLIEGPLLGQTQWLIQGTGIMNRDL